ncbi:hypothetical protein PsW64_00944 [Pseudovibrio sp. W64]|nr:hypothetical protein PsW64_00944 [Pseudovibrio sp. W64]
MSNNIDLRDMVTVIIRSIGERTEQLCHSLIATQVPSENIHIVGEVPFSITLEKTYKIGLQENRKWTLCIDSDVLVKSGTIKELIGFAETCPEEVFEVNALAIDKFLVSPREVGQRLYRTSSLDLALEHVHAARTELRPETFIVDKIIETGLRQEHANVIVGIHDFEQSYRDIFRKVFIHTKKHRDAGVAADYRLWEKYSNFDEDFKVALAAYDLATKYSDSVMIDRDAKFMALFDEVLDKLKLIEKDSLSPGKSTSFELVSAILNDHLLMYKVLQKENPSLYRDLKSKGFLKKLIRRIAHIRLRKDRKLVKLFGITFVDS